MNEQTAKKGWLILALDRIERTGNALPERITRFALLALAVIAISWVASMTGMSAVHPGTGATIAPVNLASAEGVRRMLGSYIVLTFAVWYFVGTPLGPGAPLTYPVS